MYTRVDDYIAMSCINDGALAVFLTKPVKFWPVALMNDMAFRVIKIVVALPVIVALLLIYKDSFSITVSGSPVFVVLAFALTFWLSFLLAMIVGFLAFFIEEVWGFQHLKEVTLILLSGVVLPYDFFPPTLQTLLVYTPFPYLVNWPLRFGFSGSFGLEFLCAGTWLVIFTIIVRVMWVKGMRKYSGMGAY
jgi:ABC-2 type transport system permease protein